jgi:hypothetical protein
VCAKRPLCVRGEEVIVFRERANMKGGVEEESGVSVDAVWLDVGYRSPTSSSNTRVEKRCKVLYCV